MSFPLPDVFNDAVGATAADLRDEVRREFAILPSDSSLAVDLSVKPAEVGGADYHSALRADGPFPPLAGDPDNAVRDRQRSRRRESSPNTAMLIAPAVRHLSGQRPCTHRRTALSGVGAADIWTFQ